MGDHKRARAVARVGDAAAEIVRLLRGIAGRYALREVWRDWVHVMALAIANGADRRREVWDAREAEYMRIAGRYAPAELAAFKAAFALVVDELEVEPRDLLGSLTMALELGNDAAGQFFTPDAVSLTMARMTFDEAGVREAVARRGYVSVHEPALGGGGMLIAALVRLRELGLDTSTQVYMVGVDLDRSVLLAAYMQLSLLGVPAMLIVGDSLRLVEHEHWFTPVYVWGGWGRRLALERLVGHLRELSGPEPHGEASEPGQLELVGLAG